jgi:glycerol-3-phosphate dehydrogenase
VEQVGRAALPGRSAERVRLVKGCHIVVPRLHPGEQAFLLQNADGRVVFVIPYEQDFSLIGTTDEDFAGDPAEARISAAEIDYLVAITNECFRQKICAADVLHHFAGVRPLLASDEANASKVSRDYTLTLDRQGVPLLTVHGGKITTYRRLAESAMERLRAVFPSLSGSWTATAALPGGDFSSREALRRDLGEEFPWVPPPLLERWLGHYGTLARVLLGDARGMEDLGEDFGFGLHAREVEYLQEQELAQTTQDILWRRSKLGLRFTPPQIARLDAFLQGRRA